MKKFTAKTESSMEYLFIKGVEYLFIDDQGQRTHETNFRTYKRGKEEIFILDLNLPISEQGLFSFESAKKVRYTGTLKSLDYIEGVLAFDKGHFFLNETQGSGKVTGITKYFCYDYEALAGLYENFLDDLFTYSLCEIPGQVYTKKLFFCSPFLYHPQKTENFKIHLEIVHDRTEDKNLFFVFDFGTHIKTILNMAKNLTLLQ